MTTKRERVQAAVAALVRVGYTHEGDLGLEGRDAMAAPDDAPQRQVYVCIEGSLHLRNHLAVRAALRKKLDLREAYGDVKLDLARNPDQDIDTYTSGKSDVLQLVLQTSDLTPDEKADILCLNATNG